MSQDIGDGSASGQRGSGVLDEDHSVGVGVGVGDGDHVVADDKMRPALALGAVKIQPAWRSTVWL